MRKELRSRPLVIFYILLFYILASLVWWTYLLLTNIKASHESAERAMFLEYRSLGEEVIRSTPQYQELQSQYNRQRWMIVGESGIFLLLLTFAALRIRRSYTQEMELSRQQRNFLLSITHELKSPLSSIKLGLETLNKQELDENRKRQLLSNSLEDANRLQLLVEDILMAARFEDEGYQFAIEEFNLSELVLDTARKRIDHAGNSHVLEPAIQPNVFVRGDETAVATAVSNLVGNAIKYSPGGSQVSVSLEENDGTATVAVADEGLGVPVGERKRVFRRFYRIGNEDTRKTKGTGLGLFIVKQVVERHKGKVRIEDGPGGGALIRVTLPTV